MRLKEIIIGATNLYELSHKKVFDPRIMNKAINELKIDKSKHNFFKSLL